MALGVKSLSFENLEHIELDSVDSICLSDSTSKSDMITVNSDSSIDSTNIKDISEYAKLKVLKILRSIKKLEKLHIHNKSPKLSMLVFMDMIRDQQYKHVSMNMLHTFMKTCIMVPKAYYLHYFMFFLHYAAYYHHIRATTDIIDHSMKDHHTRQFIYIKAQLKYLQYIIKESRLRSIQV